MSGDAKWWKGSALYQVYPRSFCDTSGNGIGDLKGITQKLDYIASLGVEGIWISPFFKSPMKDYGYDVSDYRDIDPLFGTLADFDDLLKQAHKRGLKIIVDLVLSHTSDQHSWFSDPDKKDWYVWADAKPDMFGARIPPNNWVSVFGGSAWEWDERYGQYYLHNFLKEQPDLNYHNPDVQKEALDICRFWLERGVDGFRLDVINFLFHDQELRDNPPRPDTMDAATQFEGEDPYSQQLHLYDKSRPENLAFIRKLRQLMDEYEDRMTLGEIGDDHPYERAHEYTEGHSLLNTAYNTHMMGGKTKELTADFIREPIENFLGLPGQSWPTWAFSNHDVVRAASRWLPNSDGFSHNPAFSKMLMVLLGTLYGTAFIYQGEELGLPEARLTFDDLQDPWGKHLWPEWQGRDGCRTPFPWSKDSWSDTKSWLPMPEEHKTLSVAEQENNPDSMLNFTRRFMKWRKEQEALTQGRIEFIETFDAHALAFKRMTDKQTIECVFNFSEQKALFSGSDLPPFSYKITGFED